MQRHELEHVIGAAANVTDEDEFIVVGSQAILGAFPDAPQSLLRSIEADIYPVHSPEKAEEIDGAIGDGSPFHRAHGYYAHGVGPETAKAPAGWQDRLVPVDVPPRPASKRRPRAFCLEQHDLVLAKCAAGRPRDWNFAEESLKARLVLVDVLFARIDCMPVGPDQRETIRGMLQGIAAKLDQREPPAASSD